MAAPAPKDFSVPNPFPWIVKHDPLSPIGQVGNTLTQGGDVVHNAVTIGKFFTDPVRLGEAFVGIVMIAVGINAALKDKPASTVNRGASYVSSQRNAGIRRASAQYASSDAGMQQAAAKAARKKAIYKAAEKAALA